MVKCFRFEYYVNVFCTVPSAARNIVFNQIKIEGFIVTRWAEKVPQALKELKEWIDEVLIHRCILVVTFFLT